MKLLYIALLGTLTLPALAQNKAKPVTPPTPAVQPVPAAEPTTADLKRELAIEKVKNAVAQAQLAEANIAATTEAARQAAMKADQAARDLIASTQKELGLDSRYEWNFQAQNYVMKPQVGSKR